jgi:aminotransferase
MAGLIAQRVSAIPGNPFADTDAKVNSVISAGADVIDLSKGNPDGAVPPFAIRALEHAAHDHANFRYPPFDGKPNFLQAISSWYRREQGVIVDPSSQVLATCGASVGIGLVMQALVDPGDLVVVPGPYYPQYEGAAAVAQGRLHVLPTDEAHGFLPDLDAVPDAVWRQTKLLMLNYPNNPTGAAATPDFFAQAVRLARQYGFAIVHDFAYAGIGFDEHPPISLLSIPGASEVGVELGSLSKMYMMAGWRAGWVAGNAGIVSVLKTVHRQMCSLVPTIVQDSGTVALNSDQSTVRALASEYRSRHESLQTNLARIGLHVCDSHGGLFAWMEVPEGRDDAEFADWLLRGAGVAVIAGSDFGPTGAGYVRLSLLKPESELAAAADRIKRVLGR